jgi:exopolysaccharide production protein ExoZ
MNFLCVVGANAVRCYVETTGIVRAIAATMIVFLHAQGMVAVYADAHSRPFSPIEAIPFGAGVDLFFVISGFVIVYASVRLFGASGGMLEFMRRRLIRIVPLYWSMLTFRVIVLGIGVALGAKVFPSAMAIVTSYFFIPYDTEGYGPDYPFPILNLGWTLNYEMFFYVLFACFIGLRLDLAVLGLVACLSSGIVLAAIFPPANMALRFWLHPIAMEFAFGAVIAWLYLRGVKLNGFVRGAMIIAALVLWIAVPLSWFVDTSPPGLYSWARVMILGVGAALIIAAAAMGPTSFRSAWSRAVASLGDSSYALYLIHPFVFLAVKAALTVITLPVILYWPAVFTAVALSIVCAALFHSLAEVPVVTFLRKITARRIAAPADLGR